MNLNMNWMQGPPTAEKLQKQEDDARAKANASNENYKHQLALTNNARARYFEEHLPYYISMLKQTNDACDHGLQHHLIKYAHDMEDALMQEATTLSPVDKDKMDDGIVKIVERINNSADFHQFMTMYFANQKHLEKAEYQYLPYSMKLTRVSVTANPNPVFGIPLAEACAKDNNNGVPLVVTKCIAAVETYGIRTQGLYRLSGTHSQIQKLRALFDKSGGAERVNMADYSDAVSVVTSVLKLYFRELPDSLLPKDMYHDFIEAAAEEDPRMRLIKTHEIINRMPDCNYNTLQVLAQHLWSVQQLESENKMGAQNLSLVWGPTLMNSHVPPPETELKLQSRVIETIITHFTQIFEA